MAMAMQEFLGSPLHSAGLSMENPFEMFEEVGRSLKWFNLSRGQYEQASCNSESLSYSDERPRVEEIHHQDSDHSDERPRVEEIHHHDSDQDFDPGLDHNSEPDLDHDTTTWNNDLREDKPDDLPVVSGDPVSGLVKSFFGLGRLEERQPASCKEDNNEGKQRKQLAELHKRMEALEAENAKLTKDKQRVRNLLKEKEKEASRSTQDRIRWEKEKAAFHAEKEELLHELRREKRLLEKQAQSLLHQLPSPLPTKKERQEIADLKAKLVDVHEEHMKKEARLRMTNTRLRKFVKELSGRLAEQQEEIKRYERILSEWRARSRDDEKAKPIERCDTEAVGCRVANALCHKTKKEVVRTSMDEDRENRTSSCAAPGPRRRSLVFKDGTREEEYADGLACLYFPNGDIKNSLADGTTEYYYSEIDTWHTTKPDGVQLFYFPHNQVEEHWPDGRVRVVYRGAQN